MGLRIPPSLRHARFRALWLGLMLSVAGSQMQVAGLHWHIRTLTGEPDPLALGGIGLARILPVILFSLIGGVVADRADRRKVMLITQSSMALIALVLMLLTFNGHISIALIYLLTALQAVAIAFDLPARQALVPNLVPKADLPNAFSMTSIAFNTGAILGPAVSGLVIATLGQPYVYLINAISFVSVLAALVWMGPVAQQTDLKLARSRPTEFHFADIQAGIQFILTHPIILSTMLMDFFATFFASAKTMLPIVAKDILHVGEEGYGLLSAADALGALAAGLVASQLTTIRRQGPTFLASVVVFGLATILFGWANNFWLAMLALFLMGVADSISTIIRNTIRQLQTPDYIRGRMISINQIFFQGGPQLGEVEAGVVASFFGVPFAILSGGVGTILAVAIIAGLWPQLRDYEGDEPLAAKAAAD